MRAIEIAQPGGPEVLRLVERPMPAAGPGEILLRVEAAGVNRPDILQRLGQYPPPPGVSDLPGLEIAGTVVALGTEVSRWREGDTVCALVAGGGYAEFCVAPALQALPLPHGVRPRDAAAIPETFFTVWTNLFERGGLAEGETVLVHGGSSGIGTTAIQLAKAFGAHVIATAGSPDKCQACLDLGADRAVNYRMEDFVAVAKEATGGRGVDVILDMVGGDYVSRNLEALAVEGRLVQIAFLRGARAEVNLLPLMQKRITFTGSTLRARSVAEKGNIAAALRAAVWPKLDAGELRPVIQSTHPLSNAADAHAELERGEHVGKIVLVVRP